MGPKSSNYRAYSQMSHRIEDVVFWTEDQVACFLMQQDVALLLLKTARFFILLGKSIQEDHSVGHLCLWNREKETNVNSF